MTTSRLIFIDGIPGTGKSATAHRLCRHLRSLGRDARWVYEHETPHPVIEHARVVDVLNGGPLDPALHALALENWSRHVNGPGATATTLFESTFFQTPLHVFFFNDRSLDEISKYVDRVVATVRPCDPRLVLLRHADLATALPRTYEKRGEWFAPFLSARIAASPLGARLGLTGLPGLEEYFRRYQDLVDTLAQRLEMPCLAIETDAGDWASHLDRICAFLELPPLDARPPRIAGAERFAGTYRAVGTGNEMTITASDGLLRATDGALLFPSGERTFEVEGTCILLAFEPDASGRMERMRASGSLPALDPLWTRIP